MGSLLLAFAGMFAVLFTDGMRVGWAELRSAWRLPGRALGWGLPLTLAITAVGAHYLVGLGWIESLLIGAILAPTDPVFAAALVGNEKVPPRLRRLLNVESGVNDGLALPFVMVFLAIAAGSQDLHLGELGLELGLGVVIGVAVPWAAIKLEQTRWFSASTPYEPLNALAIGLLVLARPAAIWLSFLGSGLSVREQAAVAWLGPKGFASVVYALIVLSSGIAASQQVFQLVAVTIVASILLHSSTDIVVARGFDDERDVPAWFGKARRLWGRLPEDGQS